MLRRNLFKLGAGLLMAPGIVQAANIMPVSVPKPIKWITLEPMPECPFEVINPKQWVYAFIYDTESGKVDFKGATRVGSDERFMIETPRELSGQRMLDAVKEKTSKYSMSDSTGVLLNKINTNAIEALTDLFQWDAPLTLDLPEEKNNVAITTG